MRLGITRQSSCLAAVLAGTVAGPVAAECLTEEGFAALERGRFSAQDYRALPLHGEYASGDYGYEYRQRGSSFIVKAFRPNFVFAYYLGLNEDDALISARYTAYDMLESGPVEDSFTIYFSAETGEYSTLCGEDATGIPVEAITVVLHLFRELLPE